MKVGFGESIPTLVRYLRRSGSELGSPLCRRRHNGCWCPFSQRVIEAPADARTKGLDDLAPIHALTERHDDAVMLHTIDAIFVHCFVRNRRAGQIRLG